MEENTREYILDLLKKILIAITNRDSMDLRKLSNYAIKNTSLYQDKYSVQLAVICYSLSKIIERNQSSENSLVTKNYKKVENELKNSIYYLEKRNLDRYKNSINNLFEQISSLDQQLEQYIEEIIEKSKIKKSSNIYEHGISLARSAEILGISQWQLMNYIGKTTIIDKTEQRTLSAKERLVMAKKIFGLWNH